MDYSKIKKIVFILLILLVVFFPFWCVRGFCASNISPTQTLNARIDSENYIVSPTAETQTIYIFKIVPGREYSLTFSPDGGSNQRAFFVYDNVPTFGSQLINVSYIGNNYKFVAPEDATYFVYYTSTIKDVTFTDLNDEMSNSVDGLVNNVGINSIWNIFDISINYIVVVVLFAFGVFIIFRVIRKISKGKEGL